MSLSIVLAKDNNSIKTDAIVDSGAKVILELRN